MAENSCPAAGLSLAEALIATADPLSWAQYCRLAAELEGRPAIVPSAAPGSIEWQQQQDRPAAAAGESLSASATEAGRRRLIRRDAPLAFAGVPSPLGAAGAAAFDSFLARHRGSEPQLSQIDALENDLVRGFEAAGRSGRWRASGFHVGGEKEVLPQWFGHARLDFAKNAILPPDGSEIVGIAVTVGPQPIGRHGAGAGSRRRERPSQTMLRAALVALWERGAFSAGTGNERVLALVLRELGLSAADPPYGFKSAETVRKLRKALNMSV